MAKSGITREAVIGLYTAQLFLPGLFQRKAFLILNLLLPFVDFITDYINAGYSFARKINDVCIYNIK